MIKFKVGSIFQGLIVGRAESMATVNQLKQPNGLYFLFFSELWDRFSYYGIQSILVLYLTKTFSLTDSHTYALYGVYTALAFSTPVLGGYLADRFLGYQKAICYGLILMAIGNIILLLPGTLTFYLGLSMVIAGIGLFKANNAALLGTLYQQDDARRESGFTIFYMGMNIGAILGPLIFGFIALHFGWKYGFVLSAIGLLSSLILFTLGKKIFSPIKNITILKQELFNFKQFTFLLTIVLLSIVVINIFFYYPRFFKDMLWLVGIIVLSYVLFIAYKRPAAERNKIIVILILNIFALFFFACQVQVGSSLTLFIDRMVNKDIFGWIIPTAAFSSLQPLFVILTAPLFAPLWNYLEKRHYSFSTISRIIIGLLLGSISFACFAFSAYSTHWHTMINVPLVMIVIGNFILGAGELCIGPAMMSAVTYLIPKELQGRLMGMWFLSIAFSSYLGSLLAQFADSAKVKSSLSADIYLNSFSTTSLLVFTVAVLLLMLSPLIRYLAAYHTKTV